jgi:hypothetical protein
MHRLVSDDRIAIPFNQASYTLSYLFYNLSH